MIGTRVAHYEITNHLGSGGMGDVYQATDLKLRRNVAIKILPEAFARHADRAMRFEHEAHVLASLNHPNIAALYGLEESGGLKFLVMELVVGETLAERIKRGRIAINEALLIAKQIADGIEGAHEKGIVHRDLKPANIKLTPDGKVKILDFGLAKAFQEPSQISLSNTPTLISASASGVILGTPAYMSPEQAKGKEADRSSDIWAFGCLLYEMITGYAAYEGETVGEILERVFKAEPNWSRLPADTPEGVRRLLRRCMQRDRNRRLQTPGDARIEIEEAFTAQELKQGVPGEVIGRRDRVAWVIAIVATILMTVFAFLYLRVPSQSPEMRLEVSTPATEDSNSFALSPDGRRLIFVASQAGESRLWLRPLDVSIAQPLAGTEGASSPFFSPDGQSVGFFAGGKLKRADIGGPPMTLANAPFGRGGTWNSDGTILFAPSLRSALFRIKASGGGEPAVVTKLGSPGTGHAYPQFLPDGRRFLFFTQGGADVQGIYLGTMGSERVEHLIATAGPGLYIRDGWLLYLRQEALVAKPFDLAQGKLTGNAITLATPIETGGPRVSSFSVALAGTIAYRASTIGRRQLAWFDRNGVMLSTIGAPDPNELFDPTLSPDAERVAVTRTIQNNRNVWLLDALRATPLTDSGAAWTPIWSHDGRRLIFGSNRRGFVDLYERRLDGDHDELLVSSKETKIAGNLTVDGRFLLYTSTSPSTGGIGTSADLWVLPLGSKATAQPFLNTRFDERYGQFSPDGRWVAYQSNESGDYEIYIKPFPGPGERVRVSTAGGIQPRWRRDGTELYYVAPDARLMAAPITGNETKLTLGTPIPLFRTRIVGGGNAANFFLQQYDSSRDGRFLVNIEVGEALATPITLIVNWKDRSR